MEKYEMISKHIEKTEPPKKSKKTGECCFCLERIGDIDLKNAVSGNFTNYDLLGNSPFVCEICYSVLKSQKLRRSSWIISQEKPIFMTREDISQNIFSDKQTPFVCYVTTSFKKNGVIKVDMQYDSDKFVLLFEETPVCINAKEHLGIFEKMSLFYSIPVCETEKKQPKTFFTKEEIRTGEYKISRIQDFGISEFYDIESDLKKYRQNPAFGFFIYILNAECKNKYKSKGEKIARKTTNSFGSDIRDLEVDSMGQCQWFT